MEDFAFKIQLGLILPKIKSQIGSGLSEITDELVNIVQAGADEGEQIDLAMVKETMMKDLEIFLDRDIMPAIDARLNPPEPEAPAEETGEAGAEAEGEGEPAPE
ncbi:MAG: hypothetical protein AAFN27_11405 [Pseudomonadota bacterium]